jgi:transcriptional regulator with XRE-family HTH domain
MILRKLRDQKQWSQEQLAHVSGLNVRTIQRVESGKKASLETLKCLAAVFEVDISKLTEEITVIDKKTEQWKELPWWFRANMFGIYRRKYVLVVEFFLIAVAFVYWFIKPDAVVTSICLLGAYITGWIVRYGDRNEVW